MNIHNAKKLCRKYGKLKFIGYNNIAQRSDYKLLLEENQVTFCVINGRVCWIRAITATSYDVFDTLEEAISYLKSKYYKLENVVISEKYENLVRTLSVMVNGKEIDCKNPEFLSLVEGAIETGIIVGLLDWLEEYHEIIQG